MIHFALAVLYLIAIRCLCVILLASRAKLIKFLDKKQAIDMKLFKAIVCYLVGHSIVFDHKDFTFDNHTSIIVRCNRCGKKITKEINQVCRGGEKADAATFYVCMWV